MEQTLLFLGNSFFLILIMYICVGMYVPISASAHSGHKGGSDPIELKLQVVVNHMLMNSRNQSQIF